MDEGFTIDELATISGVPTRTIRQYQTLGLLAPPERVGRVGRYRETHRERLATIARLQARGYSLAGMRDLFAAWQEGHELGSVIGAAAGHADAPVDEISDRITTDQLHAAIPALARPATRRAAIAAGLVTSQNGQGEGWFVRSPSGLRMVADLIASGIAPITAIGLFATLNAAFTEAGREVAAVLTSIPDDDQRTALLHRNRALLGRTAATLLVDAIGRALPVHDTDRIRIGAVRDRRAP